MSTCNILIIGGNSVGKTHIFNQIAYHQAAPRSLYPNSEDTGFTSWCTQGRQLTIQVRDTISTNPTSVNATLCRNLHIVLFVYSLDRKNSIDELVKWHESIYKHSPHDVIGCLVGNKSDLSVDKGIKESIDQIKHVIGIKHAFRVSAVTGEGIHPMIDTLAREYFKKEPKPPNATVQMREIRTNTDDAYCCIN